MRGPRALLGVLALAAGCRGAALTTELVGFVVTCRPRCVREIRPEYVVTDREGNRVDQVETYLSFDREGEEIRVHWSLTTHPAPALLYADKTYTFVLEAEAEDGNRRYLIRKILDGDKVVFADESGVE